MWATTSAPFAASGGPISTWMQRVAGICNLPILLDQVAPGADAALSEAGISRQDLSDPGNLVPFAAMMRALERSAEETGCAHLGILLGQRWRLAHMGPLGEFLLLGPTVGDGLQAVVAYQRLFSHGMMPYLLKFAGTAEFGFAVFHPEVDELATAYDCAIASTVSCLRELCGDDWSPSEVHLPRAHPVDERPYRQHFRCPVKYDEERAAVYFPLEFLARGTPQPNAARRRALEDEVSEAVDEQLLPLLYRSLRRLILEERSVSMPSLAAQLAMHQRTLHRRLQLRGLSFRQILDDVRFEVARNLLRDTRRPIRDIAHFLGYSDVTAFCRSFRRWAGTSPAEWRAGNSP